MKFYYCEMCKQLVYLLVEGKGELVCCGEPMKELEAGTVDAAKEKHVPEIKQDGEIVNVVVGSVEHPMEEKHYIQFIALEQGDKAQVVHLEPGDEPKAQFKVEDGPFTVYEFCNLHGLWKADSE